MQGAGARVDQDAAVLGGNGIYAAERRHMKFPITKPAFRTWLKKHAARHFRRRHGCRCPIAMAIRDGGLSVMEVDTVVCTLGEYETVTTPQWASRFIERVDRDPESETITGAQAQKLLR